MNSHLMHRCVSLQLTDFIFYFCGDHSDVHEYCARGCSLCKKSHVGYSKGAKFGMLSLSYQVQFRLT